MIAQGNLSAKKSMDVVKDLYNKSKKEAQIIDSYTKRIFKVYVDSLNGNSVKIKLPVILVKSIISDTGKLPIKTKDIEGIDIESLSSVIMVALKNNKLGEIATVDSRQGDKVKIIIE